MDSIKESISFIGFCRANGNPEIVNLQSGEEKYTALNFPRTNVWCGFSKKLGNLTAAELLQQAGDLQVVTLAENNHHILCKRNKGQEVDILSLL